ncbi:MAG TPA: hypothetical protein V6D08_19765 [Candidatus Obscuribacterales bacterium]
MRSAIGLVIDGLSLPAVLLLIVRAVVILLAVPAAEAAGWMDVTLNTGQNCDWVPPLGGVGAGGAGSGAGGGEDQRQRDDRAIYDEWQRRRSSRDPTDPRTDTSYRDTVNDYYHCRGEKSPLSYHDQNPPAKRSEPKSPWQTVTDAVDDYVRRLGGARD